MRNLFIKALIAFSLVAAIIYFATAQGAWIRSDKEKVTAGEQFAYLISTHDVTNFVVVLPNNIQVNNWNSSTGSCNYSEPYFTCWDVGITNSTEIFVEFALPVCEDMWTVATLNGREAYVMLYGEINCDEDPIYLPYWRDE